MLLVLIISIVFSAIVFTASVLTVKPVNYWLSTRYAIAAFVLIWGIHFLTEYAGEL